MSRHNPIEVIPTLRGVLFGMNVSELKRLGALIQKKLPTRKSDLVEIVVRHVKGDGLRAVWQSLDETQRAAVAEVVHSETTQFSPSRFRAKYGKDPDWGPTDGYRHKPSALGFFFPAHLRMPEDLKERLRTFVPPPAEDKVRGLEHLPASYEQSFAQWNRKTKQQEHGTESIPLAVRESERSAPRELFSVLRLVDAGKVAVSEATRRAAPASITAVTAVLEGGDYYPFVQPKSKYGDENAGPIRAFAWPLLIQAGGLAQLAGSKLQLTKAGRKALAEPAVQTLKVLWERWLDTALLDELSRIDCVKGQTGKGKHSLTALSSRREAIAAGLAACPVERWVSTAELSRFLRASDRGFSVSRNPWHLYVCQAEYGSLGYDDGVKIVEERYLLALLFEYAATLGLIDVAFIPPAGARSDYGGMWGTDELPFFSRYDGLLYFRLTALGAYCLGCTQDYKPAPLAVKPALRVLPNLEIAAIGVDLEPGDRLALDAYAVRISDHVWQLERPKLLAAAEKGRSIEEIREFLTARSGGPLPDTVTHFLQDAGDRCVRVRDRGPARLFECADGALAALIANDTRLRKYCLRAGESLLAVPAESEIAFRRSLRELGYLPALSGIRPGTGRETTAAA